MTVLVVDDNPPIREVLAATLQDEGYAVATASNGRAGLAYLRQHPGGVRLIILDLTMPEMSGWEFLQARRADPELCEVPVLVLSAYPGLAAAAIGGGQVAYLRKPWQADQLSAEVRRLHGLGSPAP